MKLIRSICVALENWVENENSEILMTAKMILVIVLCVSAVLAPIIYLASWWEDEHPCVAWSELHPYTLLRHGREDYDPRGGNDPGLPGKGAQEMKLLEEFGVFLLFPIYCSGYILGFLFEIFWFGFIRGRKRMD